MRASIPEPAPLKRGKPVTAALKLWIMQEVKDKDARDAASDLVTQRDLFGRQKYGQSLMTDDGRDGLEDLKQELGDALQYAFKCRLNGKDIKGDIMPLINVLQQLVESE
jgi:hypothetical protein